jgi:hypothetical protein
METKFLAFLSRLESENNRPLIQTIQKGFKAITESYADVRDIRQSALDMFNEQAAMTAQMIGNDVLTFLQNSSTRYSHLYSKEEKSELDTNPTSQFNQYVEPIEKQDELEEHMGLTAEELAGLNA